MYHLSLPIHLLGTLGSSQFMAIKNKAAMNMYLCITGHFSNCSPLICTTQKQQLPIQSRSHIYCVPQSLCCYLPGTFPFFLHSIY